MHYSPQQIESGLVYMIGVDKWMIEDATYYVAEISGQIVGGGGWSKRAKLFGGDQMTTTEDNERLDPDRHPGGIRAFRAPGLGATRNRPTTATKV